MAKSFNPAQSNFVKTSVFFATGPKTRSASENFLVRRDARIRRRERRAI